MMQEQTGLCLATMALVEALSARLGTLSYLWGGCALDAYEGRILRAHRDIDYMTVGLAGLGPQFAALFREAGWEATWTPNAMVTARTEGIHIALGALDLGDEATWWDNGDLGYVRFPAAWLRPQPVDLDGVPVHVVEPEFEYMIKSRPRLLNPDWNLKERHIAARERLREILQARGVDPESLYPRVSHYTGCGARCPLHRRTASPASWPAR